MGSKMKRFLIFIAFLLLLPVSAYADTHNVASPYGAAETQTQITASSNGDIVSIPACEVTWSTSVTIPEGLDITIQGAGKALTVITTSNRAIYSFINASRITGIGFIIPYGATGSTPIEIRGAGWRIDNCAFTNNTGDSKVSIYANGRNEDIGPAGLIDSCTFVNGRILVEGLFTFAKMSGIWSGALGLGTNDAVYIEDCSFTRTDGAFRNTIDANRGGKYVYRFNTVDKTYLEAHSLQSDLERATRKFEIYGNTITSNIALWTPMYLRGGTGVIFKNTISGSWTIPGGMFDNVRSAYSKGTSYLCDSTDEGSAHWDAIDDSTGWLCRDQIGAGTDATTWVVGEANTQANTPAYVWDNTGAFGVTGGSQDHIKISRDYYEDSDGGVAIGTSLPGSCTEGQAYFKTDEGSWNTSTSGMNGFGTGNGVLYTCDVGDDAWSEYYTPYAYPHPLRAAEDPTPPDTDPPTDPASLSATAVLSTQIDLTWTASTDDVEVTGYSIEQCDGAACSDFAQVGTSPTNSYSDTGLTASTLYRYQVRASDAIPNYSGYSNIDEDTTPAATSFNVTVSQAAGGTIAPGTTAVDEGSSQAFTFTPDSGYSVNSVLVDSSPVATASLWTDLGTQGANTRIRAIASGNGVVIGVGDTIIRSTDAGATWSDLGAQGETLLSVMYAGNDKWVIGATSGKIFYSSDAGANWNTPATQFSQTHIYALCNFGDGDLAAGSLPGGLILLSDDYGATWSNGGQLGGAETTITSLENIGGGVGVAGTGGTGKVYKTLNRGTSWSDLGVALADETYINGLTNFGGNVVIASTYPGSKILRSDDACVSWTDLGSFGDGSSLGEIATSGAGIGVTCESASGECWRTTDIGLTWTSLGRQASEEIVRPAYIGNEVYVAGTSPNGKILRSTLNGLGDTTGYTFYDVQAIHTLTATYAAIGQVATGSGISGGMSIH